MEVTLRQLETLVALGDAKTLPGAARILDATTTQQIKKSLERLATTLNVPNGLYVVEGDGTVTVTSEWVLKKARTIVNEHRDLIAKARFTREFWIRIDAFGSHLATFVPPAIARFEHDHPGFRIDLVPGFGSARSAAGAGMLQDLAHGNAELSIFPRLPQRSDTVPPGLPQPVRLYEAVLVAAISVSHPFISSTRERYRTENEAEKLEAFEDRVNLRQIWSGDLANTRLISSPAGHLTHELLLDQESGSLRFTIETTHSDPMALVALGARTSRVPIIASDSAVPWPKPRRPRGGGGALPQWFVVVDDAGRPISWDFAVCWQQNADRVPTGLVQPIERLKDLVLDEAAVLRERSRWWLRTSTVDR